MRNLFNVHSGRHGHRGCVDFSNRTLRDQRLSVQRVHGDVKTALLAGMDPFLIDMDRVENSVQWRRLDGLSQYRPGLHFSVQNRLTHTIMARTVGEMVCNHLGLGVSSTNLVKATISAHDIGQPPFSHYGERGINSAREKYGLPAQSHDMNVLRILLEWAEPGNKHRGLNLTMGFVESVAKRFWRFEEGEGQDGNVFCHDPAELPRFVHRLEQAHGALHLDKFAPIEGQIAAISDWIAATATDAEDALRRGELSLAQMYEELPLIREVIDSYDVKPEWYTPAWLRNAIRDQLLADMLNQTRKNIDLAQENGDLAYADDARNLDGLLATFSPEVFDAANYATEYYIRADRSHGHGIYERMVEQFFIDLVEGRAQLPELEWDTELKKSFDKAERALFVDAYMCLVAVDSTVLDYIKGFYPSLYADHLDLAYPSGQASLKPAGLRI